MIFSICSCNNSDVVVTPSTSPTPTAAPSPTPIPTPEPTPVPIPTVPAEASPIPYNSEAIETKDDGNLFFKGVEWEAPDIMDEAYVVTDTEQQITNIPTYTTDWITKGYYFILYPGFDHGVYLRTNNQPSYVQRILKLYPSYAWRKMSEDRYYVIYDLTDGTRLYLFFPSIDNQAMLMGYPLFVNKVLSHSDMRSIKLGDDISVVEAIDPIAKYTKDTWIKRAEPGIEYYKDLGNKISSVHLLTDGIMRISYELTGEIGNYTFSISEIEYHEDFKLEGVRGVTDYSIAEVDYID